MKTFKMTLICVITVLVLAAFCACSMEDGRVDATNDAMPSATSGTGTDEPQSSASPKTSEIPNATDGRNDDNDNLGDDIGNGVKDMGDGVKDIGDDIKDASGAAKQVNG